MSSTTVVRREVDVTAPAGLHARPAAEFAATAARFDSEVRLCRRDREVDAKSVLLLLTLDVRQGDRVVVVAEGVDADAAVDALSRLLGSP
jgi:phosphotransferase system HPr (HPr) family protein